MLRTGQIIEIVTHEGGKLNIRRVKLDRVRRHEGCHCGNPNCGQRGGYAVKASNLHGKYQRSYVLPEEPIEDIRDPSLRDCVNWVTVEPAVVGEI